MLVELPHLCLRFSGLFVEHFERLSERDWRTASGSQDDDQKQLTVNEHLRYSNLKGAITVFSVVQ